MDALGDIIHGLARSMALEKNTVKTALSSIGLGPVWIALRDSLLSPKVLVIIAICIALERVWAAHRRDRLLTANLALDYLFPLINAVTFTATLEATLVAGVAGLYGRYLPFLRLGLLQQLPTSIQVVAVFVTTDLVLVLSHYLHHRITPFWYLHSVHHSQEDLNPLTTYRVHPLEGVTKAVVRTIPFMVLGGTATTIFWFTFLNSFWGFFIHSNISLNLGPLKYVLVTPQYHRVHHSKEERHFDKNFGERLTLWDWLFGTMWLGFDDYPATGVKGFPIPAESDRSCMGLLKAWWNLTLYPFRKLWRRLREPPLERFPHLRRGPRG